MRRGAALLALAFAVFGGEGLEGPITGGKAKQLVDEAVAPLSQADAIYKEWFLDHIAADQVEAQVEEMIRLYDEGTAKLQAALDIQYDPGVNHRLLIAARHLQRARYFLFRLHLPKTPPREPPKGEAEEPAPPAETRSPPPPAGEEQPPPPAAAFQEDEPPALPADVEIPAAGPPRDAKRRTRDEKLITQRLRDYMDARRESNLLFEHRMCAGKGKLRDGSTCQECSGSGKQINLFHFRRAFWTGFTPMLRDAPGALDAFKAFYGRARKDPKALGALVKGFQVAGIEHHDFWARARVVENGTERRITLVSIGSSWFFYRPETDRELIAP
ncbi:MAG: hypothetical protein ACREID_07275 [Planctomycetota bacterium]